MITTATTISTVTTMRTTTQTWKKERTRGHCPQKFWRIGEISGLWKIDYSYLGIKLMNYENFSLLRI